MRNLEPTSNPFSAITRRHFLKAAGAVAMMPTKGWGARGTSASNRITLGVIGWGMMGPGNTKAFLAEDDCQVVAACDLHKGHLQTAVDTINTTLREHGLQVLSRLSGTHGPG